MLRDSSLPPRRDASRRPRASQRRRPADARRSRHESVPSKSDSGRPGKKERKAPASAQHREDALFYDPPYTSQQAPDALADRLARQLVRHLQPSCGLFNERIALTPRDCFRLDFLIEADPGAAGIAHAGILLGGREEAEGAPALYDALIVGSGAVDVLYRFEPEGLAAHLTDALFLMSDRDPALFARRERLQVRASKGGCAGTMHGPELRLSYPAPPVDVREGQIPKRSAETPDLVMRRMHRAEPHTWIEDYRHALDYFGIPEAQREARPAALTRTKRSRRPSASGARRTGSGSRRPSRSPAPSGRGGSSRG